MTSLVQFLKMSKNPRVGFKKLIRSFVSSDRKKIGKIL